MDSLTLVIFGITSNLAQIKLLPALYDMAEKGLLPKNMSIVGVSRQSIKKDQLKKYVNLALNAHNRHHKHAIKKHLFEGLVEKINHIAGDLEDPKFYFRLQKILKNFYTGNQAHNIIYYLATYPDLYHHVFEHLSRFGMNQQKNGWVRLMIEKPIGNNLESAKKLNTLLLQHFSEDQIFRLDHYLGKETVQNILTFRFSNGIFEPLMNRNYIDHIQITAAEDFGIGDRGGYYDNVGALKDVGQNHLLQLLAFATMDAPYKFSNQDVTKERLKILQTLIPMPETAVFGQYKGYQKEPNIKPDSPTETFFAFKTEINSERFKGVPIYIRGGKKLKAAVTEVAIVFKNPSNRLFKHLECGDEPNVLIFRIQPDEGIILKILSKKPGHQLKLEPSLMEFKYPTNQTWHFLPDPYERLVADVIRGDQTFFNDAAEVEAQWAFIDPLMKKRKQVKIYLPGSWGPKSAERLIAADGKTWLQ